MRPGADDVVIAGMACRYPDADDPARLWENVLSTRRAFRRMPPGRLSLDEYGGEGPDSTYVTHAAVLEGWEFDRHRFRVPGDIFRAVDLTHWLALETCSEALRDAGLPDGEGLDRDRVGVVLGNSLTGEFSRAALLRTRWPYLRRSIEQALLDQGGAGLSSEAREALLTSVEARVKGPFPVPSEETLAGGLANTVAGRVCNHFDFHGTGFTVDGACASSLVAVATGADAITAGRLDVVLAGGVDLSLDPFEMVGFARLGALSRGGMRVYDAAPTGFLPGEGCGVVVLCRAGFAKEHRMPVYARLLGWGLSSDGHGGLTRPEPRGQRLAIERAHEMAGLAPSASELIEGHGTGTAVGDEVELRALTAARGPGAPRAVLGTVKANIGHTKAAAGVAGLIKATLAVHHATLPPTTGVHEPHELLRREDASLEVLSRSRPWTSAERYAGVSAFGFGGINAHVVLGAAGARGTRRASRPDPRLTVRPPGYEVVVCSASDSGALARQLREIERVAARLGHGELTDLAADRARHSRGTDEARCALAVATPDELHALAGYAAGLVETGTRVVVDPVRRLFLGAGAPARVALLFPGQAAPCYPGAGPVGDLHELPSRLSAPMPVDPGTVPDTALAQPAVIRSCLAGLSWIEELGAGVDVAVGHSVGEIAALVWAGALTIDGALELTAVRGRAMSASGHEVKGGMLGLSTDVESARELLAGQVVVAADNGEHQTVVAGPRDDLETVAARARDRGLTATWVPVAHAFHSPAMADAAGPLRSELARTAPVGRPELPVVSTITGRLWGPGDEVSDLLVRQLTEPVRWREALNRVQADLLVEVGPGQVLAGLAGPTGRPVVSMDIGSGSAAGLAAATAALFAAGAVPDVHPWFARRPCRPFDPAREPVFLTSPCQVEVTVRVPVPSGGSVTSPAGEPGPGPTDEIRDAGTDLLSVVRQRVAGAAELAPELIAESTGLMADLHLSSLRITQLAGDLMRDLDLPAPPGQLVPVTATVGEVARALGDLSSGDPEPDVVEGVSPWVRAFGHHVVPASAPSSVPARRAWQMDGLEGHPLAEEIGTAFSSPRQEEGQGQATRLLALPPGADLPPEPVVRVLKASAADRMPLVVLHHGGVGAAIGRSLAAEYPDADILVLDVPPTPDGVRAAAAEAATAWRGHHEIVHAAEGSRMRPVSTLLEVPAGSGASLGEEGAVAGRGDVVVVSGGAHGIGLECALALGAATGARMVLLGRSPATAATVRSGLARFAPESVVYEQVDVTDAAGVRTVMARVAERIGPVRGLLHAAGRNVPALIADITTEGLRETLAPKITGFENLVACVDPGQLRFVVTFGSVIARTGLAGQAEYAIANEWLGRRCRELTRSRPRVRWLNVGWSVWEGTGMGEHLGAVDRLRRQGVAPIPTGTGTDWLLRLLATPGLPPDVMVSGRLPAGPGLARPAGADPGGRFLETLRSHTPQVELIADSAVSLGTDQALADHRVDGVVLLPAVLGLEAMAQAAVEVGAKPVPGTFRDLRLAAPVTVPERGSRTVRVAVLAGDDGSVRAVLRSEETGFSTDHFAATQTALEAKDSGPGRTLPPGRPMPAAGLYGSLFFHGPRFARVRGLYRLGAYEVLATVGTDPGARWFGEFLDQRLVLGDPAARDAMIHVLQACVPDRRVLPVSVDRVTVHARAEGEITVHAVQMSQDETDFVFDVTASDVTGVLLERWSGLRVRSVGPLDCSGLALPLVGPLVTRALNTGDEGYDVRVVPAGPGEPGVIEQFRLVGAPGSRAGVSWHRGTGATSPEGALRLDTAAGPITVEVAR
ncbi:type I polyketide synthase [Kineosporia sp. NBRC 101731]|uniref:type I polyketide synthase n=1 Tax=Kineosporia sp. NBRC 101731 TaxID=3032199 RepID=UPI0024A607A4|nr:type I polyketide synthase [Kineosporia sp. NBRC 101731]GLY30381.1 polyketide synthase [Kineosporia sp. NBRC 101731]